MERGFVVDDSLLRKARVAFHDWPKLYWILGGSCTGKSAVSEALAGRANLHVIDMDARIYDRFMPAYQAERHPASNARFGAQNPLNWALSLSWEEFDALNRAADAELLDLLVDELETSAGDQELLIDGGFTHPSLLAQVVPAARIVCLETTDEIRFRTWETDRDRALMRQWVHDLPDGGAKWRKFLFFDKMLAKTMSDESRAVGVEVVAWDDGIGVGELSDRVMAVLEL